MASATKKKGKRHFVAGFAGSGANTTSKRESLLRVPEPPDDGRLSKAQLEAIRAMEPQDFTPTRSFLDLFRK